MRTYLHRYLDELGIPTNINQINKWSELGRVKILVQQNNAELAALRSLLKEAGDALELMELNIPESEITNTRIVKDVVARAAELRKKIEEATATK